MGRKKKEKLPPPPPRLISKKAAYDISNDLARLLCANFWAVGEMTSHGIWQIIDDDWIDIPKCESEGPNVNKAVVLVPVEVTISGPKPMKLSLKTAILAEKEYREEMEDPSLRVIESMVEQGLWIITEYDEV